MVELKNIRIGYANHEVIYVKGHERLGTETRGKIWHDDRKIALDSSMLKQEQINTIIHEILHGLFHEFQLLQDNEERTVTCLANGFSQVFEDNPQLLEWIMEQKND